MVERHKFLRDGDAIGFSDTEKDQLYIVRLPFEIASNVCSDLSPDDPFQSKEDDSMFILFAKFRMGIFGYKPRLLGKHHVAVFLNFNDVIELGNATLRKVYSLSNSNLQQDLDKLKSSVPQDIFELAKSGAEEFPSIFEDIPRRLSIQLARNLLAIDSAFVKAAGGDDPKLKSIRSIFQKMIKSNNKK